MSVKTSPPVLDYDGAGDSTYRTDFWEGKGREYEDRVERIALGRLLKPSHGKRLLELGAGFGRLSSFYSGYNQVVLVDYSMSQLEYARSNLGDEKFLYVAADIYRLPFADGVFDAAAMIRVIHHFADVPAALAQIRAALCPGALFVLEFANKRNLKAILRYALRRQDWNPYSEEPVEFVKLNFDFHPRYMEKALRQADFEPGRRLAVSFFRLGLLKRLVPVGVLTALDSRLQSSGILYSPSIFTGNYVPGVRPSELNAGYFKCPVCGSQPLQETQDQVTCTACDHHWSKAGGIYDFREPLA